MLCLILRQCLAVYVAGIKDGQIAVHAAHSQLVRHEGADRGKHGSIDLRNVLPAVGNIPVDSRLPSPVHRVVVYKITADDLRHPFNPAFPHRLHIIFIETVDGQLAAHGSLIDREIALLSFFTGDCQRTPGGEDIPQLGLFIASAQQPECGRIIFGFFQNQSCRLQAELFRQQRVPGREVNDHAHREIPLMDQPGILLEDKRPLQIHDRAVAAEPDLLDNQIQARIVIREFIFQKVEMQPADDPAPAVLQIQLPHLPANFIYLILPGPEKSGQIKPHCQTRGIRHKFLLFLKIQKQLLRPGLPALRLQHKHIQKARIGIVPAGAEIARDHGFTAVRPAAQVDLPKAVIQIKRHRFADHQGSHPVLPVIFRSGTVNSHIAQKGLIAGLYCDAGIIASRMEEIGVNDKAELILASAEVPRCDELLLRPQKTRVGGNIHLQIAPAAAADLQSLQDRSLRIRHLEMVPVQGDPDRLLFSAADQEFLQASLPSALGNQRLIKGPDRDTLLFETVPEFPGCKKFAGSRIVLPGSLYQKVQVRRRLPRGSRILPGSCIVLSLRVLSRLSDLCSAGERCIFALYQNLAGYMKLSKVCGQREYPFR